MVLSKVAREKLKCRSVAACAEQERLLQTVQAQASSSIGEPHEYGIMVECDGVLVDIHKDCHRVAFNQAFEVCTPCLADRHAPQVLACVTVLGLHAIIMQGHL